MRGIAADVALMIGMIAQLVPAMGLEEIYNLSVFQWDTFLRAAQMARMDEMTSMVVAAGTAMGGGKDAVATIQGRRDAIRYGQPFDENEVLERALNQKFGKPVSSQEIAGYFQVGEPPPQNSE